MQDRDAVKRLLAQAVQATTEWLDANDALPESKIDMGVWFSDLAETEMLGFVEHPRYAEDYSNAHWDDVEAYQVILIPIPREQVQDAFDEVEKEDRQLTDRDEHIQQLSEEQQQEFAKLQARCLKELEEFLDNAS